MLLRFRRVLFPLVLVLLVALPTGAAAQDEPRSRLVIPTTVFAAAATADWITTYHALKHYHLRESNPLLKGLDHAPGRMVALGAALDVAGVAAWNTAFGRRHPRLAAAGLWGAAAFRAYLAVHNLRNERRAVRR